MKQFLSYIIIITTLFILTISSCRYSTPILKSKIKTDTIVKNETKKINKEYLYFRISRYGFIGEYYFSETYTNGEIDSIETSKHSTHKRMKDGVHTVISKTIKFSKDKSESSKTINNKNVEEINFHFIKRWCKGYFKKKVYKVIYYDGNVKRNKIVKKEVKSRN